MRVSRRITRRTEWGCSTHAFTPDRIGLAEVKRRSRPQPAMHSFGRLVGFAGTIDNNTEPEIVSLHVACDTIPLKCHGRVGIDQV
jgi:hypothetical protein